MTCTISSREIILLHLRKAKLRATAIVKPSLFAELLMRKIVITLLDAVLLITGGIATAQTLHPTYSYRYRLTLSVELDGKIHSGSSVIEVKWRGQPYIPGAGASISEVHGQATLVDLGSRGALVATLFNGESYGPSADGAINALWLVPRAFNVGLSGNDFPRLAGLRGRKSLAHDNMPRLVWFSNPADPKSARKLRANDIPSVLGPNARLAAAYVEITEDPVVVNIDRKLTWLRNWEDRLGQGIPIEYGFALKKGMFIGDAP